MEKIWTRLVKYSGLVFGLLLGLLLLDRSGTISLGLRHRKVLELIFFLALAIFGLGLVYKSFSGYKKIFRAKDYAMLKDIAKIIIILGGLIFFINLILNRTRVIGKSLGGPMIKFIIFVLLTSGLAYDELVKK